MAVEIATRLPTLTVQPTARTTDSLRSNSSGRTLSEADGQRLPTTRAGAVRGASVGGDVRLCLGTAAQRAGVIGSGPITSQRALASQAGHQLRCEVANSR